MTEKKLTSAEIAKAIAAHGFEKHGRKFGAGTSRGQYEAIAARTVGTPPVAKYSGRGRGLSEGPVRTLHVNKADGVVAWVNHGDVTKSTAFPVKKGTDWYQQRQAKLSKLQAPLGKSAAKPTVLKVPSRTRPSQVARNPTPPAVRPAARPNAGSKGAPPRVGVAAKRPATPARPAPPKPPSPRPPKR